MPAAPQVHRLAAQFENNLQESIAYQLRITYKYFVQNLQPILDQHDVSIGMWYYLRALWDEDGLTQRQISDRVGLVAPTTVEALKNMEKRGLLLRRRSAEDRRKVHVYLTAEGKALKDKLLPFVPLMNMVAMQDFTPEEVAQLRRMLSRMQEKLAAYAATSGLPARGADLD